ncbi:hypothetical protein CWS01_17735 [Niallia nealsonii]|uniref:VanZ-like domain-containing protein n=1 Tax=Niallia nealsonii TaxID=115979 RepID=A0A2N0YYF7_9BACI|nr:hypothetical protein CWS01_17735 [Niallia nealsonii]
MERTFCLNVNMMKKLLYSIIFIGVLFLIWIKSDIPLSLNFPIILLMTVPFWIYYRIHKHKKYRNCHTGREIVVNLFFLYLLTVLYVTLNPFHFFPPGNKGNINLIPYVQILYQYKYKPPIFWMLYTLGNILLFVPFGFLFPALYKKRFKMAITFIVATLSSLTIELTQYFFTIDRAADIDDFILNIFGSIIGYFIYFFSKIIINKGKTIIIYFSN